jgi:hypothetical protein
VIPALEGIDGWSYCHSWGSPVYTSPAGTWWQRLQNRHGMAGWTSHHQSGARMAHLAHRVHGYYTSSPLWTPASGLVVVMGAVNDMVTAGADPHAVAGYRNALSEVLAMACAGIDYRANGSTWTYPAGTWTAGTNGCRVSTSLNAVAEVAFSGGPGSATVHLIGWPAGTAAGIARIRLDGQIVTDVPTGDAGPAGLPLGYTYLPVQVPIPAAGSHVVRVSNAGASGTWLGVQNLTVDSARPPTVLACMEPELNPDPSLWPAYSPTVHDTYRQATVDAAAGRATVVHLDDGWGSGLFHPDGMHPHDAGHACITDQLAAVLSAQGWRDGQNRLT